METIKAPDRLKGSCTLKLMVCNAILEGGDDPDKPEIAITGISDEAARKLRAVLMGKKPKCVFFSKEEISAELENI